MRDELRVVLVFLEGQLEDVTGDFLVLAAEKFHQGSGHVDV